MLVEGADTCVSENVSRASGRVKWFDPVRGYGFVISDNAESDILLHMSVLKASGFSSIVEGATVVLTYTQTDRGLQAASVLEIDESTAEPPPAPPGALEEARPSEIAQAAPDATELTPARVKWFDKDKGFGFVNLMADPEDVFIHMETLRRYAVAELAAGEAILVRVAQGPRGRMASEVRPWSHLCERL